MSMIKAKPTPRTPAVDCTNEIIPPLDFSFCRLTAVEDALEEEPRIVSPIREKPRKLEEELLNESSEEDRRKSKSRCLRLHNNAIADLSTLISSADKLFEHPKEIGWLDLSFNELTSIDDAILDFENLRILYLHGNAIANIDDVKKLANLPHLRKLCLHGNQIESIKGYRQFVLAHIPQLLEFDFSNVTKTDRASASAWARIMSTKKKGKKSRED
ncbi:leucine-rich repeat-containing protein 51-like [Tubulanus polymorphus]|uniref:leucine-rich repeat-containing protein 51-like n=1 Tax=Tubulanus polymorphus TaxID=672921 RepID=UPI003DA6425E